MALQEQRAQDSDSGGGLADLRGGPKYEIHGRVTIRSAGARHAELPNVERLAAVPAHCPKIAYTPKVLHFQRRVADQFTNYPGIRKHPVAVTWNESASGDAANNPPPRCTVTRRREKDIALAAGCRSQSNRLKRRYAPQCRGALNIGGKASRVHSR